MTPYPAIPTPPAPQAGQTTEEYRGVLLRFVLAHRMPEILPDPDLEHAGIAARHALVHLPAKLDDAGCTYLRRLLDAQELITACQLRRARYAPQEPTAPASRPSEPLGAPEPPDEETHQARVVRLLRAALTALMAPPPPDAPDGGQLARLQPKPPTMPSPGIAMPQPTAARPQLPEIAF